METGLRQVTREEIERLWSSVRASTANPSAGIFGPASISWKINRESALFLGAGRAALLQLAHPWVAAALDQHSNLRNDPLARFHSTFRVVFTMVFGTLDQALAASRFLFQRHTKIQGQIPETAGAHPQGSRYEANEVHALVWVYATLIESAIVAYQCVLPPLSDDDREAYYTESKTMAALFGIPRDALPADWAAFQVYMGAMVDSEILAVNALSREMAGRILHGRGSWVPVPGWYRALTASCLLPRLREDFALPYGLKERNAAGQAQSWLRHIYPELPSSLRFVGPYHEALSRLRGRPTSALTRASNRFWIGQPRMMFPARETHNPSKSPQPVQ
jgi:uncharacterized protein (DUF2236 family)